MLPMGLLIVHKAQYVGVMTALCLQAPLTHYVPGTLARSDHVCSLTSPGAHLGLPQGKHAAASRWHATVRSASMHHPCPSPLDGVGLPCTPALPACLHVPGTLHTHTQAYAVPRLDKAWGLSGESKWSALLFACAVTNRAFVEALIKAGADVHASHPSGLTPAAALMLNAGMSMQEKLAACKVRCGPLRCAVHTRRPGKPCWALERCLLHRVDPSVHVACGMRHAAGARSAPRHACHHGAVL